MFNIFGGGNKDNNPSSPSPATAGNAGSFADVADSMSRQVNQQTRQSGAMSGGLNFDPSGLERAAKAVRELDSSKNANAALEISRAQEATKQLEHQRSIREYEAHMKGLEIERVKVEQDERRKTLELETSHYNYRAKQQDELARKRQQEKLAAERQMQEEALRRQEDSVLRQESMKRETIEYEAKLKRDNEMARVAAETEGKIRYERENHDLHVQDMKLQAAEFRETTLEAIKAAGTTIGRGFQDFIADGDKVFASISALSLLALGVYTAKVSTGVVGRFVETRLGKPSLVRETSRRSILHPIRHPIDTIRSMMTPKKDTLQNIVIQSNLEERLRSIVFATVNSRRNGAPYRHLLLHGPPGTGKTMFAKSLAKTSGMDYAILTGADVAPLSKDAVLEIHKVFDWAERSNRGLLLFVDEADAFLRKRDKVEISENMRNALNAFLYRTGETSKRFMVVLASNQPDQLDRAINDRMDEMVLFDLPGARERRLILEQYFQEYMHGEKTTLKVDDVPLSHMEEIAKKTEGFSGRELSKLVIAWQAAAYANPKAQLTREMVDTITDSFVTQHNLKDQWHSF